MALVAQPTAVDLDSVDEIIGLPVAADLASYIAAMELSAQK
jgi:hypothetical protein